MNKIKFKIKIPNKLINLNDYFINQFNKFKKFNKIKFKIKIPNKLINLNDYFTAQFKRLKKFKFKKISNLSLSIILFISLLFLYLFYLSIPSLYDKGSLQKDLSSKLINEFNINFSISSEINYSILPSPHILIKNAKILNDDLNNPKEIVEIKELKIFISQKNFFRQNDITIKSILINKANFFIKNADFDFLNNYINKKFSKKNIKIKNSNIFYKNKNDETISIFSISNLNLFFDNKKFINQLNSQGKIFQTPFEIKWNKNFKNKIQNTTLFELKKLNFKIQNESSFEDGKYIAKNQSIIGGVKLVFDYQIQDNLITLVSSNSELIKEDIKYEDIKHNENIKYNGAIKFDPFDLELNIDLEQINLDKLFLNSYIFQELLKTNLLFNKNLNGNIILNANKVIRNKLFDSLKILLNFKNGEINFDDTYLLSNKIGSLNLYNSSIEVINNEFILKVSYDFNIQNQKEFFKFFQIAKSNRRFIKNIYFDLEYNMFKDELKIMSFKLNDLNNIQSNSITDILYDYNSKEEKDKFQNWIGLKRFVNKLFINYTG